MSINYATREAVKSAVDVKDSARANAQIDRLLADASRSVDRLCHRVFYPRLMTKTFDWPDLDSPTPWRLWLPSTQTLISVSELTSGGVTIDPTSVLLYPSDGPPYTYLELDQSTAASFESGDTVQQSQALLGLFGWTDVHEPAGTIAEELDDSETAVDVADGHLIGVGSLLRCGTERMIVTERSALATGATLGAPGMTAEMRSVTVPLSTATNAPVAGEMIIIDGERMLVTERLGTTAYVTRAYDGTVLAAHTAGAAVYAYRTLTVERGALGSTAAVHTAGAALERWKPPGPVEGLTIAETLNSIAQENSGYARVVGQGEGQREARGAGLADKRQQVYDGYAAKARTGVV
jgi:hypothetical protein